MRCTSNEIVNGLLEETVSACRGKHGLDDFFLSKSRKTGRKPSYSLDSGNVVKLEIADLGALRSHIVCNTRAS